MNPAETNSQRILRIYKGLSRSFNRTFHNVSLPEDERRRQLTYRHDLLKRSYVLMVKYGHMHPNTLRDITEKSRK